MIQHIMKLEHLATQVSEYVIHSSPLSVYISY